MRRSIAAGLLRRCGNNPRQWVSPWSPWLVAQRGCKFATGYTAVAPKTLDSIIKVEALKHATPQEITSIWNESFICDPCKEKQGLHFYPHARMVFILAAQMPYILFTGLEDYKRRGTAAAPYFTVTHYSELVESKGLVLARGDIVFVSKLSDEEARSLLQLAHSFYLEDSRFKLVEDFNKRSDEFEFQDVLKEIGLPVGF